MYVQRPCIQISAQYNITQWFSWSFEFLARVFHSAKILYSSSSSIFTPFPQLTSTIHLSSHPNFFSQMERDSIFLHHHHNRHDLLPGLFFPSDSVPRVNNIARPQSSQQLPRTTSKKKNVAAKKDRHSKIYTAQGPRDRRVRLSMEIARKFFDLQDLLGFDKASKTLDWLLTHSKAAIKELVQMKINCTTGGGEMICENNYCNNNETTSVVGNEKRDAFDISSRESRAKARARARDRTREKMRAKEQQLDQESLRVIDAQDLSPNDQSSRSWPHIEASCDLSTECWDISTDVVSYLQNINTMVNPVMPTTTTLFQSNRFRYDLAFT